MNVVDGIFLIVVGSFGIKKIEEEVNPKTVISERALSFLVEFSVLVSNDQLSVLSPNRDSKYYINLVSGDNLPSISHYRMSP